VQIITLTTDFGARDWFVGVMKGVILGINPRAEVLDLTHEIAPGDIRGGAFALSVACRFFPKGTLHVAVVDPGVGSDRPALAVRTADYGFVGPDNGVLSFALQGQKIRAIHRLENTQFFLKPVSRTFHGRDIFAPVAGHLSRGVPIHRFGPRQKELIRLKWPQSRTASGGRIEGEVVYLDRFGNAITNVENASLKPTVLYEVFAGRRRLCPVGAFYGSVRRGAAVAVPGSTGFLEIAVNGSSAACELGLAVGSKVSVTPV